MRVQRADERYVGRGDGWVGRYCFSYDGHYDPTNVSFGRLLACNEFVLEPGARFGLHRHAGVDIVTVVLSGELTHATSEGSEQRGPGSYVFATGEGVEHDERNDGDQPVRFVQTFLLPGEHEQRPDLHELGSGETALLDSDERLLALVVRGRAVLGDVELAPGDSARLDPGERSALRALGPATVLVWDC